MTQWFNTDSLLLQADGMIKRRGALAFWKRYNVRLYNVHLLCPPPIFVYKGRGLTIEEFDGSDLGSIPPDLQWLAGDNAAYPNSFTFHDFVIRKGYLIDVETGKRVEFTRDEGDKLLKHMVRAEGANKYRAYKIYKGASLGSKFKWMSRRFAYEYDKEA